MLGREAGFELPERARVVLHSLNHYRLGLLESRTYPHGVLICLAPIVALGQPVSQSVPRTAWGDPDLRGIWDYWTFTPLERPGEFDGRERLTDEEAAAVASEGNAAALARDAQPPPAGAVGAYGQAVWTDRARATALTQSSLLVDPPDGKIPGLTPEAMAATEAHARAGVPPVRLRARGISTDGPDFRGAAERCLLGFSTGPPILPGGYNNNLQIFQVPGYVVLLHEMVHDVRVVPLDGRPQLPSTFTRPFTGRFPLNHTDGPLYEYACHEGNHGMMNMLTGGRSEEQADLP